MRAATRVPVHRSLVVRLLATSVLVALGAILATAWLAVQSTTQAGRQEQGRSLADDKSVYDLLLGQAATHRDWSGVGPLITARAARIGRRITLMTPQRQVIADSAAGPSLHDARPSATVDPLRVDLALTGGTDVIDPRAVGPYKLTAPERASLRAGAARQIACMRNLAVDGWIMESPSGRPVVRPASVDPKDATAMCRSTAPLPATATEQRALTALRKLTLGCLHEKNDETPAEIRRKEDDETLVIEPDFTVRPTLVGSDPGANAARARRVESCVLQARQEQLRAYVAGPALLFVTAGTQGAAEPVFTLSRATAIRIAAVTLAVLLVTVLVTVLAGRRLVRPLRALTEAARKPVDSQAPVPVTTRDEIGLLATALNELAARREQTEAQRKSMVSDVAHELRTPLTNIRSWLEAAQDGLARLDPPLLGLLLEEAVQLQHLLDDLRDLAAADAGDLRVHREPASVPDLLDQVAEAHRGAAESAGVRLCAEHEAGLVVPLDGARLRQLVGNLVANAVQHTPPGGTVTIRSALVDGTLAVTVADTGTGIAAADLPRVFERFWRADGSRNRRTGGSGLGLTIAADLAAAHGGTVEVDSTPGAGSIFTVLLPAGKESACASMAAPSSGGERRSSVAAR